MLRIVVCICKADICQSDNGKKGQKRSWCSDINEAISYMNTYGGWLQEGDICQGSILDLMVIRYSLYFHIRLPCLVIQLLQAVSVKLFLLSLQCR